MGCGGTVEYLVDDVINTMRAKADLRD